VVVTTVTFESIALKDPTLTKVPPLIKLSFCSTKIIEEKQLIIYASQNIHFYLILNKPNQSYLLLSLLFI